MAAAFVSADFYGTMLADSGCFIYTRLLATASTVGADDTENGKFSIPWKYSSRISIIVLHIQLRLDYGCWLEGIKYCAKNEQHCEASLRNEQLCSRLLRHHGQKHLQIIFFGPNHLISL